eukprot:898555-Rhodomonas_salina.1
MRDGPGPNSYKQNDGELSSRSKFCGGIGQGWGDMGLTEVGEVGDILEAYYNNDAGMDGEG